MVFLIIIYYFFAIFSLLYFFVKKKITPTSIFILAQILFFSGMIKYLNFNDNSNDLKIVLIYLFGIIFFSLGAFFGEKKFNYSLQKIKFVKIPFKRFQYRRILIIIFISFCLMMFFCYVTRLSTVKTIIGNLFFNRQIDITDSRIESYSVPGTAYIYMFRITLLPTVVIALLNKEYGLSNTKKTIFLLFMLFFSLITGQRGGFFMIMLMWIMSYIIRFYYGENSKESKIILKRIIFISFFFIIVFFFMSTINGRVTNSVFAELIQRFFEDNQQTAYVSFQYIFDNGISWGKNWYEELVNIIVPGDKFTPLSKIIFNVMYGSTRGTAPPCLWGSVFYNFSWIGIIVFGFLYGILCQYISYKFFGKEINGLRCIIYSYMFVCLGMLVAGGPFQLVNNGFVPLVFLTYILHGDKYAKNVKKQGTIKNCSYNKSDYIFTDREDKDCIIKYNCKRGV